MGTSTDELEFPLNFNLGLKTHFLTAFNAALSKIGKPLLFFILAVVTNPLLEIIAFIVTRPSLPSFRAILGYRGAGL